MALSPVPSTRWMPLAIFLSLVFSNVSSFSPTRGYFPLRTTARFRDGPITRTTTSSTRVDAIKYTELLEKLPSNKVIQAVESTPSGVVIASDIAQSAGVSLPQASKDLAALASLSGGDIAVSKEGDLIYNFPPNVKSVVASNNAKYKAIQAFEKVKPVLFYLLRASFGVALVASLVAIFSTIFFISTASSSSDDDDRGEFRSSRRGGFGGGGFLMDPFWGPSPFDFLYYRPSYGYYETVEPRSSSSYSYTSRRRNKDAGEDMGFLESTFSYIFGDGNPNQRIEEKRLKSVTTMIRAYDGAVTAEQLAPFCDDLPQLDEPKEVSNYVDESFVLPIVTKLGGEPRVTEDGDIIYVFPELQKSVADTKSKAKSGKNLEANILEEAGLDPDASSNEIASLLQVNGISIRGARTRKDLIKILSNVLPSPEYEEDDDDVDSFDLLQEREYQFSLASGFNKLLAGGLGIVNLGGALYLGQYVSAAAIAGVRLPGFFGLVQAGFPFLLGYAILYNVIPLLRLVWIKGQNESIRKRNSRRRRWRTALQVGGAKIRRKLKAAQKLGSKLKRLGRDDIYYDTTQSMEDLDKMKSTEDLNAFDKLLQGS